MLFIIPALAMLPFVAIYFSLSSTIGHVSSPFPPGPLTIWTNWFSLRISPPSHITASPVFPSLVAVTPNLVTAIATPPPPGPIITPSPSLSPTAAQSTPVSPQFDHDINPWALISPSTHQAQLLLPTERSPPPSSPTSSLSDPVLLLDGPPKPSPTESVPATRTQSQTSLTDVRRSIKLSFVTPRKFEAYPSSKQVKSAAPTRMSRFEYMQVKGCFVTDPRACPRTSILEDLLDGFVDPVMVFLVLVTAMVCAIGISAGSTLYSSGLIGIPPTIPHTLAIPTGCSASQQVLDASNSDQDYPSVPPRPLLTFYEVAVQTDDCPFQVTPSMPVVIERAADSSSAYDASHAGLDGALPATDEAQSENEGSEMEVELAAAPPAVLITPSNSGTGDLSMALAAVLNAARHLREYRDEPSLSPLYLSPQSTAPPSPVLSEAPSFSMPDWRDNQIFDPDFLRRYGLGPDGLRPSLSQRSSVEGLRGLLEDGDSPDILPSASTPLDALTILRSKFGTDDLTNFVFDFSVQCDVSEGEAEDRGASSSMGSEADSSGFEFVFLPPFKRCRREHEDGGTTSLTVVGLAGVEDDSLDNSEDDAELSMELTSVLDDVLDRPSTAGSESPSTCESEPLVMPNILIIVNSPPRTPPPSHSEDFDQTGFEDDIPMSSTPIKSRPSLDTFRDLSLASIRSQSENLLASPCLDRHRANVGSPSSSLSMSSLDLARHLPPLTASENSDSSRVGASSVVSGSGSVQSSLREAYHHRPLESASSDESTSHIPPTWSFDLEAYRHPPPVSTDDSFFVASCRSSLSSTSNAEPILPVSESISDSAGMVAVGDNVAVSEEESQEPECSFNLAENFPSDENLLDQTFSAELAGCDDSEFGPLYDFEPAALLLSSGALLDSTAERNPPPKAAESMVEAAEELSSCSLPLVKLPAPFALPPGSAEQDSSSNSVLCSPPEQETLQDPVPCAMQENAEAGPSTPKQDVALTEAPEVQTSEWEPKPRVFAKEATPGLKFDMSRLESLASSSSTPASKAYHQSFESLQKALSPLAAAPSPLRDRSTPATGRVNLSRTAKVQESGWTPRSDVFVRECTPDLTFDASSVASPGLASLTPTSMAHAQSFDFLQKASPTSRRGPAPSPLRECSNTSYPTPSRIPIRSSAVTHLSQRSSSPQQAKRGILRSTRDRYNPHNIPLAI